MKNLSQIKTIATRTLGRSGLILKKYSPEILTGIGVVGVVVAGVMACRATLKLEETVDDVKEKIDDVHDSEDTMDQKDYKKDLTKAYVNGGWQFVKLYGPSVSLGAASIGCILGGHNIMKKRNVALMAAYKTVEEAFSDYRKRVVEELGDEKDEEYRHGISKETVVEIDKDGKTVKKEVSIVDGYSQHAKFFDSSSREWSTRPEENLLFLRNQQNWANDLLRSRGHVFLNEVYDMLGIDHTQAGAIFGWVLDKDCSNHIDFGIYDDTKPRNRAFVNGFEPVILLDFNVDGIIFDKI